MNAIRNLYSDYLFNDLHRIFFGKLQGFHSSVDVHRCPRIQTKDSRNQHPALQNEVITVLGQSNALKEAFHDEIADQSLHFCAVTSRKVSDFCFQLCCNDS